jgi:hypothetical protein
VRFKRGGQKWPPFSFEQQKRSIKTRLKSWRDFRPNCRPHSPTICTLRELARFLQMPDATDVSFMTIFGTANMISQSANVHFPDLQL